jgi:hypothetical protein
MAVDLSSSGTPVQRIESDMDKEGTKKMGVVGILGMKFDETFQCRRNARPLIPSRVYATVTADKYSWATGGGWARRTGYACSRAHEATHPFSLIVIRNYPKSSL